MKFPAGGPIRRYSCPFCRLEVVFNDETLTTSHRAPECEQFRKLVEEMGASPGRISVLGPDRREVKDR